MELAVNGKLCETGKVEQSHETETLGDEAEVLVKLESGNHLGTLVVLVTHYEVGIRVHVTTLIIITEHNVPDILMFLIFRIICREKDRIGVNDLVIHLATAVKWSRVVGKVTGQSDRKLGSLGNVDIDV